jgi:hypothetical protein
MIKQKSNSIIKKVTAKRLEFNLNFSGDYAANATTAGPSLVQSKGPVDDKFSINKLINKILKSELGVPLDIKIDDSSMPLAPNFVTFLNSPEFLNVRAFSRQNEIGTRLFAEWCPRCSDTVWMEDIPVDCSLKRFKKKVVLMEWGKCPKCGMGRSDLIKNKELPAYQEAAVCAGQRSAKSHISAMLAAYIVHRYLKLQNPVQLMGLVQATTLHGTFVALTYAQARDTLWEPFSEYLSNSPWFQAYHSLLDTYSEKYKGEEIYKVKDTFILYRHRGLLLYPSGPNMKTLRGRTRIFCEIDELGWFDNSAEKNKVKDNANEVYIALERSLLTVRAASNRLLRQGYDNTPTGYFVNVSSPSHARDKIMELINKAKISKKIYAMHRPTWEMNPNIAREDLEDEFIKDPVAAERDYGANPPLANSPLLSNIELVDKCFKGTVNKVERIQFKHRKDNKGDSTRYAILEPKSVIVPSILAIDSGFSNNSFSCAVGHLDKATKRPVFTTMVEIQPRPGVPLNYTLIYNHVLVPLMKVQNVVMFRADRWNSLKLLSDAGDQFKTLDTGRYSLKYEDMSLFKDYILSSETTFPKYEWKNAEEILHFNYSEYPKCFAEAPVSHLLMQLLTVQDTGKSVLKASGLTDDIWRATALAFTMLIDKKYEELFLGPNTKGGVKAMGSVMTKLGSSGSSQQMVSNTSSGKVLGILGGGR